MTEPPTDFPARLDLLMKAEGWSTRDLSALTGKRVSHSAIAQWISGENRATLEQVRHVAEVFQWDAMELLHGRPGPDAIDRMAVMDASLRRVKRATAALVAATAPEGVETPAPRFTSPKSAKKAGP